MGLCASVGPAPFLAGLAPDNHLVGGIHDVETAMGSAGPMGSATSWGFPVPSTVGGGDDGFESNQSLTLGDGDVSGHGSSGPCGKS